MATSKTPAKRAPAKKRASSRSSAAAKRAAPELPDRIYANASPVSVGGVSMFDMASLIQGEDAFSFVSEGRVRAAAANRLRAAGFEVLQVSDQTINIAGPASLYESVFGTSIYAEEREAIKEEGRVDTAAFIDTRDTDIPGYIDASRSELRDVIEGVAIDEPRYFMSPNWFPPTKGYWHLDVPAGISAGLNADRAHRVGVTGKGVKVVMVDSGWYAHPYFQRRGYNTNPVVLGPGAANPAADESGHGTGESANAFAVAPDIDFTMVKMSFSNSLGAFNTAVAQNPDIISCSWGSHHPQSTISAADQAMAAAIALAVSNGIIVVFSAGNGHVGFPGQHPDVISAGGVFMDDTGALQASNYASGFASPMYPGRNCPDVSGLVGMKPKAAYIMLPLEPADDIDVGNAGGTHPNGDETANNDGWAAFSGTSAAAPQLAGVSALIRQTCGAMTPANVRKALMDGAVDVTVGTSNNGTTAAPGYDIATGAGLADAFKSMQLAKVRCGPVIGPPVVVGPPIVGPPVVIGPPIVRPPIVRPPVIQPPVIQPPIVRPPVVLPPIVRPPVIQPPVIQPPSVLPPTIGPVVLPPTIRRPGGLDEDALSRTVQAMLDAGYSPAEVDQWLNQVLSQVGQGAELSDADRQEIETAILAGDDIDLE